MPMTTTRGRQRARPIGARLMPVTSAYAESTIAIAVMTDSRAPAGWLIKDSTNRPCAVRLKLVVIPQVAQGMPVDASNPQGGSPIASCVPTPAADLGVSSAAVTRTAAVMTNTNSAASRVSVPDPAASGGDIASGGDSAKGPVPGAGEGACIAKGYPGGEAGQNRLR